MTRFKQRVDMQVTQEQYLRLTKKLQTMGYTEGGSITAVSPTHTWLIAGFGFSKQEYGLNQVPSGMPNKVTVNSEELFLAIAAMSEGDTPIVGEYMYCIKPGDSWGKSLLSGDLCKVICMNPYGDLNVVGGFWPRIQPEPLRKATIEEIINHFTKTSKEMKIIGYKLIKPEYEEAAYKIGNKGIVAAFMEKYLEKGILSPLAATSIRNLSDAGVLDLWFEPVYEEQFQVGDYVTPISKSASYLELGKVAKVIAVEGGKLIFSHDRDSHDYCMSELLRKATPEEVPKAQEKTFKVGNFEIVVKGGKAFHKSDNITEFVKGLIDQFRPQSVGDYMFEVDEVTFSKTGCQYKSTLKEWREVHKNLK